MDDLPNIIDLNLNPAKGNVNDDGGGNSEDGMNEEDDGDNSDPDNDKDDEDPDPDDFIPLSLEDSSLVSPPVVALDWQQLRRDASKRTAIRTND